MNYYIKNRHYNDILIHSSGPWKEHSYTSRSGSKNNYQYTYPQSVIDRYNANRRNAGQGDKEKFFKYVGGNFNKYFQQNYQDSDDEQAQKLYSEAGQADALMKQINEGRSKNIEADLIAVRHHLDEIGKSGSARDKEGAARMASEFMHDLQEIDPGNAKKYSKIMGTGTYDLDKDEKNARGIKSTKKKSTSNSSSTSTKQKSTKKRRSSRRKKSTSTVSHSAFDSLNYKYRIIG